MHLPSSSDLLGCVNDAQDFAGILQSGFSFAAGDVTVLADAEATKVAIMEALSNLVDLTVSGKVDHLVFSFSSHGTRVPDRDGDEPDRTDEALAAYDIRQDGDNWAAETIIVDDELQLLFADVPDGVLVEVFLDTCHSGTALRGSDLIPGRRPKFLPAPTVDAEQDLSQRYISGFSSGVRPRSGVADSPVLFAACRADQTASDALFGARYNGAFTHYLLEAIGSGRVGSRRSVLRQVRSRLRVDRFPQTPQLDASPRAKRAGVGEAIPV